ncbi:DUF4365 domain-containing protein [Nocardia coubleae]|uniref:DUF4365 domain-containing protein n=1 Tax=Nocardia coubleae TaxID=356147 RepID=A0A846W419_9NOCA|nr:DUF4365 domain-containing protein [Nocardia coubleae]NKX87795.1 DUF4365 domain-containing protein [Nocardia coubleae]
MLDPNHHQGKFGHDYVRVLASAAGLVWSTDDVDVDGVDLCIKQPGRTRFGISPQIEVQIKTVSRPRYRQGQLVFPGLSHTQFNQLAGSDFAIPRYLFAVHVPAVATQFADTVTGALLLRHCGYFLSLRDRTRFPADDAKRKVSVHIPLSNILDVPALRALVAGSPR